MAVGIKAGAVTPTTAVKTAGGASVQTYVLVQVVGYITGVANDIAVSLTKAPLGADEKGLITGAAFFALLALCHYVGINLVGPAPADTPTQAATQADLEGTIQDAVNGAVQAAVAGGALASLTQTIQAGEVHHTVVVSGKPEPAAAAAPAPTPAAEQSSAPATGVAA